MLTIRLMRFGRKHQPFFRLVVVPKRGKPDRAKYVESVGWVDPLHHKHSVNAERIKYWMSVGAQPSGTAWNLFVKEGIIEDKKRPVHTHAVPEVKAEPVVEPAGTTGGSAVPAPEALELAEASASVPVEQAEASVPEPEAAVETNEAPTEETKEETPAVSEAVDTKEKE